MKNLALSFLFLFFFFNSNAQFGKKTYEAPNLNEIIKTHKNIALLPVNVSQNYKRTPKGMTAEDIHAEELSKSFEYQSGMFSFLISNADKYIVEFQDPARTNALLKKSKIMDSLEVKLPDEICKILNVDAIILTEFVSEKSGSAGTDIAKTLVMGSFARTGSSSITISIYDGKDGKLIYRMFKEMSESLTSSGAEIMKRMMAKVGRNFPYEKK